jgi:hypothetical protein
MALTKHVEYSRMAAIMVAAQHSWSPLPNTHVIQTRKGVGTVSLKSIGCSPIACGFDQSTPEARDFSSPRAVACVYGIFQDPSTADLLRLNFTLDQAFSTHPATFNSTSYIRNGNRIPGDE